MTSYPSGLFLSKEHWAQMETDVATWAPNEACGFVLGKGQHSGLVIPVTNVLHDPFRFRMDPEEELRAFLHAEEEGLEILAIYHSHPLGISQPSATDYNELTFPGIIYLIWYQEAAKWQCRGFIMHIQAGIGEMPVAISVEE